MVIVGAVLRHKIDCGRAQSLKTIRLTYTTFYYLGNPVQSIAKLLSRAKSLGKAEALCSPFSLARCRRVLRIGYMRHHTVSWQRPLRSSWRVRRTPTSPDVGGRLNSPAHLQLINKWKRGRPRKVPSTFLSESFLPTCLLRLRRHCIFHHRVNYIARPPDP